MNELLAILMEMPSRFWWVMIPTVLISLVSVIYIIRDTRVSTEERVFYTSWCRTIDHDIAMVRKLPRAERANHYRQTFMQLHRELATITGDGPVAFSLMTTEQRSVWIYLLKRQRALLCTYKP